MGDPRLLAAGLFGSGSHIVQIVIGIVVVVGLIGYFLLRLGGRVGGGDARAVAAAVSQHQREQSTSDATLLLVRTWGLAGHSEQWSIVVDGTVVGSVADKETVEVAVEPGHRTFRLESGRHHSVERSFDAASGDVLTFRCNSPRVWPLLLVAVVKPDLWISLTRE